MNKTVKYIALLLAGILLGTVGAQLIKEYLIPTIGTVETVEASITWLNDGSPVTSIDWGPVENSTAYILEPINITNIGTTPFNLTLFATSLSPSIISLVLSWNYTDTTLYPSNFVIVELTQIVTATGAYSYTTRIVATQTE